MVPAPGLHWPGGAANRSLLAELPDPDRVLLRRCEQAARFVRLADHEYFRVLGEKLGWGLPHVAKPGTLPLAS